MIHCEYKKEEENDAKNKTGVGSANFLGKHTQ